MGNLSKEDLDYLESELNELGKKIANLPSDADCEYGSLGAWNAYEEFRHSVLEKYKIYGKDNELDEKSLRVFELFKFDSVYVDAKKPLSEERSKMEHYINSAREKLRGGHAK